MSGRKRGRRTELSITGMRNRLTSATQGWKAQIGRPFISLHSIQRKRGSAYGDARYAMGNARMRGASWAWRRTKFGMSAGKAELSTRSDEDFSLRAKSCEPTANLLVSMR